MVGHRTGAAQLQTFYPQGSQLCCAQGEASWQDLNRSVRNVSVQDLKVSALLTRSLYKISTRGLVARSLCKVSIKIPVRGLLAVERQKDMPQEPVHTGKCRNPEEPCCEDIYRKKPNPPDTTSIEHRALAPTVKTPQCGHSVWRINPYSNHPLWKMNMYDPPKK
jgi:hypothetical protein